MEKYSHIELEIRNKGFVGMDLLSNDQQRVLKYNNCIYVCQGTTSKKIYMSQTKHFVERNKNTTFQRYMEETLEID